MVASRSIIHTLIMEYITTFFIGYLKMMFYTLFLAKYNIIIILTVLLYAQQLAFRYESLVLRLSYLKFIP